MDFAVFPFPPELPVLDCKPGQIQVGYALILFALFISFQDALAQFLLVIANHRPKKVVNRRNAHKGITVNA